MGGLALPGEKFSGVQHSGERCGGSRAKRAGGDDNHAVGAVATRAGAGDDTETGGRPVSWDKGELTGKLVELGHWRRCSATCARWRPRELSVAGVQSAGGANQSATRGEGVPPRMPRKTGCLRSRWASTCQY